MKLMKENILWKSNIIGIESNWSVWYQMWKVTHPQTKNIINNKALNVLKIRSTMKYLKIALNIITLFIMIETLKTTFRNNKELMDTIFRYWMVNENKQIQTMDIT